MATTTPNYGWSVPTSTDLVKDGATAIETLGDSVDATVKALNPETTLGDIAYRSATANTNTRLAIGSTSQVLTVAGGVPTWATPAGGGSYTTLGTGTLSGASVTISSIPADYVNLQLDCYNMTASTNSGFYIRVNGITSNYTQSLFYHANGTSGNSGSGSNAQWDFTPASTFSNTDSNHLAMTFFNYAATNRVAVAESTICYLYGDGTTFFSGRAAQSNKTINAAITSVTILSQAGTFSGGTYILRGSK
jgi:hypothetical protein